VAVSAIEHSGWYERLLQNGRIILLLGENRSVRQCHYDRRAVRCTRLADGSRDDESSGCLSSDCRNDERLAKSTTTVSLNEDMRATPFIRRPNVVGWCLSVRLPVGPDYFIIIIIGQNLQCVPKKPITVFIFFFNNFNNWTPVLTNFYCYNKNTLTEFDVELSRRSVQTDDSGIARFPCDCTVFL